MTSPIELQPPPPPSLSTLAKSTVIALLVAGVILVTIVLPAEYGIDLAGTGRWLGLTEIASPSLALVDAGIATGGVLAPVPNGPIGEYPTAFTYDVFEITLSPYDYVEYKYQLEQGATMLYSWTANAAVVHDFHGERAGGGEPPEESFDKQTRRQASGSFTAPFPGIHGWYWENPGSDPVTIRLTSSGFYSSALEIRSDRTRRPRPLGSIDKLSPITGDSSGSAAPGRQPTGEPK